MKFLVTLGSLNTSRLKDMCKLRKKKQFSVICEQQIFTMTLHQEQYSLIQAKLNEVALILLLHLYKRKSLNGTVPLSSSGLLARLMV